MGIFSRFTGSRAAKPQSHSDRMNVHNNRQHVGAYAESNLHENYRTEAKFNNQEASSRTSQFYPDIRSDIQQKYGIRPAPAPTQAAPLDPTHSSRTVPRTSQIPSAANRRMASGPTSRPSTPKHSFREPTSRSRPL